MNELTSHQLYILRKHSDKLRKEVIDVLFTRSQIDLEEWENLHPMNSYERQILMPNLSNRALRHVVKNMLDNCTPSGMVPVTYDDAIIGVIMPILLERLS